MSIDGRRRADERNADSTCRLVQRHLRAAPAEGIGDQAGRVVRISKIAVSRVRHPVRRLEHEDVAKASKLIGQIRIAGRVVGAEDFSQEFKIPFVHRRKLAAGVRPIAAIQIGIDERRRWFIRIEVVPRPKNAIGDRARSDVDSRLMRIHPLVGIRPMRERRPDADESERPHHVAVNRPCRGLGGDAGDDCRRDSNRGARETSVAQQPLLTFCRPTTATSQPAAR